MISYFNPDAKHVFSFWFVVLAYAIKINHGLLCPKFRLCTWCRPSSDHGPVIHTKTNFTFYSYSTTELIILLLLVQLQIRLYCQIEHLQGFWVVFTDLLADTTTATTLPTVAQHLETLHYSLLCLLYQTVSYLTVTYLKVFRSWKGM